MFSDNFENIEKRLAYNWDEVEEIICEGSAIKNIEVKPTEFFVFLEKYLDYNKSFKIDGKTVIDLVESASGGPDVILKYSGGTKQSLELEHRWSHYLEHKHHLNSAFKGVWLYADEKWNFDLIKDDKKIDTNTKFTMCSKDLCMLEYIPDMIDIGIKSLKVEGRMRSIYYIATVINNYRRAIDDYYNGTLTSDKLKKYRLELDKVANRDSTVQFYDKFPSVDEQYFLGREESSNQAFLGLVDDYDGEYVTVISKNFFKPGDKVEIISPDRETISLVLDEIYNDEGHKIDASRHPEEKVKFKLNGVVKKYDMLRIGKQ